MMVEHAELLSSSLETGELKKENSYGKNLFVVLMLGRFYKLSNI